MFFFVVFKMFPKIIAQKSLFQQKVEASDIEKILPTTQDDEQRRKLFPYCEVFVIFLIILCVTVPMVYFDVILRTMFGDREANN